jgi:oligoribonuclease (3'-5' exoribonuclease)
MSLNQGYAFRWQVWVKIWTSRTDTERNTGLDDETDIIIEIAVIITNGNLDPVDEGIEYVIKTDKEVLDR